MLSRPYATGVLLVLAFGLRVAFFFVHHAPLEFPDSIIYDRMAADVCAGAGLVQDAHTAVARAPLYPLFLAEFYSVFGHDLGVVVVGLAQAIMGALTSVVVFHIARQWFDEAVGWIAAGMVAVYPFFVFYTALLLTETLFILLLACGIGLVGSAARIGANGPSPVRLGAAALAGAVFGLAILTRASAAAFPAFLAPVWWLVTGQRGRWRAALAFGLMILCMVAVLTPWAVRNYRITGHVVFTTLHGGQDLYEANSPEATGGLASDLIAWDKLTEGRKLSEYERDRLLRNKALEYIRDHPRRFFQLAVIKFCRFWSPIPNYEKYRSSLYNTISLISFGPVFVLAAVGAVGLRRRWREVLLLLSPVCYYTLLHTIFLGSTRYRTPVEPYLIVIAAYVLTAVIRRPRRGNTMGMS